MRFWQRPAPELAFGQQVITFQTSLNCCLIGVLLDWGLFSDATMILKLQPTNRTGGWAPWMLASIAIEGGINYPSPPLVDPTCHITRNQSATSWKWLAPLITQAWCLSSSGLSYVEAWYLETHVVTVEVKKSFMVVCVHVSRGHPRWKSLVSMVSVVRDVKCPATVGIKPLWIKLHILNLLSKCSSIPLPYDCLF